MAIELRKSVTGELVAFDTRRNKIVASGFYDEQDFEEWLEKRQAELNVLRHHWLDGLEE